MNDFIRKSGVRIILGILVFSFLMISCAAEVKAPNDNSSQVVTSPAVHTPNNEIETSHLKTEPLVFEDYEYVYPLSFEEASYQMEYTFELINLIGTEYESGLYTEEACTKMYEEMQRLYSIIALLEHDAWRYDEWLGKYPYATQVWCFLRQNGFSEEVAAGIIGNMMVETSGGTLKLNPTIYNPSRSYYGLCQWSLYYKPFMADKSFEEQLAYLLEDMPVEFKNFGFCYRKGFTYDQFLELETPEEAALAFAKVYERCGSSYYKIRERAARTAYNLFVLLEDPNE